MNWYNGYFNDEDFCDDEVSQDLTGEDWFYDVNKSFSGAAFNGFICCGYEGKQCSYNNPVGGQEICNFSTDFYRELRDLNGSVDLAYNKMGAIWFIDPRGHKQWYIDVGDEYGSTELRKILQTSDGNYVAVGTTFHKNDVANYPNLAVILYTT